MANALVFIIEKTTMFAGDPIYLLQKTYGCPTCRQGLFDSDQVCARSQGCRLIMVITAGGSHCGEFHGYQSRLPRDGGRLSPR